MTTIISVEDIAIRLGKNIFFEHADWSILKDQHWAVIGRTGSGKTILVKAVSRLISLMQGKISYYFDTTHPSVGRTYLYPKEILILSSETHQHFLRKFVNYYQARWQSFEGVDVPTVSEVLLNANKTNLSSFHHSTCGIDEKFHQDKLEKYTSLFDLSSLMDRKIHLLSHGESKKVFFIRILDKRRYVAIRRLMGYNHHRSHNSPGGSCGQIV